MSHRTPRMLCFIEKVNKTYFNSDPVHMEQLLAILDSIAPDTETTCIVCFKSGAKKGQPCGKPSVSRNMCLTHLKSSEKTESKENTDSDEKKESKEKTDKKEKKEKTEKKEKKESKEKTEKKEKNDTADDKKVSEPKCQVELKSGAKKGQPCGKKCAASSTMCAIHSKSNPEVPENDNKSPPTDETKQIKFCNGFLKNGTACTSKATVGDTCKIHAKEPKSEQEHKDDKPKNTLRVKRDGDYYIIKETNVMFDMTRQCIIGYKNGTEYVFSENEETQKVGTLYKLSFQH